MLIGTRYKVESDDMNVTLFIKHTSRKAGNIYYQPLAYLSSVSEALKKLADLEIKDTKLVDLKTVEAKIDELYEWIEKALEVK